MHRHLVILAAIAMTFLLGCGSTEPPAPTEKDTASVDSGTFEDTAPEDTMGPEDTTVTEDTAVPEDTPLPEDTTVTASCEPNPCEHGGTCEMEDGAIVCTCADGYSGDLCETNIDDCDPNPCQNGGTCYDGVASYLCQCAEGFTGDNCETALESCDPNPCQNGGTCEVVDNVVTCN